MATEADHGCDKICSQIVSSAVHVHDFKAVESVPVRSAVGDERLVMSVFLVMSLVYHADGPGSCFVSEKKENILINRQCRCKDEHLCNEYRGTYYIVYTDTLIKSSELTQI